MSAKSKHRKAAALEGEAPAAERPAPGSPAPVSPPRIGNPYLAAFCAWLLPGLGHLLLGRRRRAGAFFVLVLTALALGLYLDGNMPWVFRKASPLQVLATLGCLGNSLPYLLLRFVFGFEGDVTAPGYDYGSAFILTAGLMNLLLMVDAWDIARGEKA